MFGFFSSSDPVSRYKEKWNKDRYLGQRWLVDYRSLKLLTSSQLSKIEHIDKYDKVHQILEIIQHHVHMIQKQSEDQSLKAYLNLLASLVSPTDVEYVINNYLGVKPDRPNDLFSKTLNTRCSERLSVENIEIIKNRLINMVDVLFLDNKDFQNKTLLFKQVEGKEEKHSSQLKSNH